MDQFDLENFEFLENGVPQRKLLARTYSLWNFLIMLTAVFTIMIIASLVVCIGTSQCRNSIPTVHVLLTSPETAPYMMLALSSGLYVFFIMSFAVYIRTDNLVVVVSGVCVYASIGVILVVFPFTGWDKNWAIIIFIVTFLIWMCVVSFSFRHTYAEKLKISQIIATVVYALCGIIYTTLKFIPKTDVGLLVVEIVGSISIICFMIMTMAFIWGVQITIRQK